MHCEAMRGATHLGKEGGRPGGDWTDLMHFMKRKKGETQTPGGISCVRRERKKDDGPAASNLGTRDEISRVTRKRERETR